MHRRSARKSRNGCQECKRRHVKCDETRPSCANCNVRQSHCSFLPSLPTRGSSASTGPSPNSPAASESAQSDDVVRSTAISPVNSSCDTLEAPSPSSSYNPSFTINSLVSTDQTFKLHHLELLHNFKTGVVEGGIYDVAVVEGYMGMIVREAVRAPYLMDQILALSAANMSVKRPHQQQFYREEAAHLQTRALVLFNAARASEATDNALASFVFSIHLSQQVLFDALSIRTDFPVLLDKLVTALRICRGVGIMGGKSWPFIIAQYRQQAGINLPDAYLPGSGPETIFTMKLAQLGTFLANEILDPTILCACHTALKCLRDLSYALECHKSSTFQSTRLLHWPVVVRPEFIKLLEERRPEALVVIAYYALLLHDTRNYWLSGDAGAFIIRSIAKFLGNYWAEWLAWPNEVIDSADSSDGASSFAPINIRTRYRVDELP